MEHEIAITKRDGKPHCETRHVRNTHTVKWVPDSGIDHWAVLFGADAPMKNKVLGPGDDTAEITANRPLDLRSHKYTVITWSGNGFDYEDPELIVDE